MNLFSEENRKQRPEIAARFDTSWWDVLEEYICTNERFDRLLIDLDEDRKTKVIYPDDEDVFKVFKLLPLNEIKVVIIGQDPYFSGNADGLAFSCKNDLSPSLKQILYAIHKDVNLLVNKNTQSLQLDYLVKQGVFLYNPILTVEKGTPLSHAGRGWEDFSREVLKHINKIDNVVWLLWGAKAREYNVCSYNLSHQVLVAEHPAAAARNQRTRLVDHFSKTNNYLKYKGKETIKWLS